MGGCLRGRWVGVWGVGGWVLEVMDSSNELIKLR